MTKRRGGRLALARFHPTPARIWVMLLLAHFILSFHLSTGRLIFPTWYYFTDQDRSLYSAQLSSIQFEPSQVDTTRSSSLSSAQLKCLWLIRSNIAHRQVGLPKQQHDTGTVRLISCEPMCRHRPCKHVPCWLVDVGDGMNVGSLLHVNTQSRVRSPLRPTKASCHHVKLIIRQRFICT